MTINFSERNNRLVIQINGDIDHHTSAEIRALIEREMSRSSLKTLEFDFTYVDFMDSSGIGLILGRYKTVAAYGGDVYISGANSQMTRIIDISGLSKVVKTEAFL